MGYQEGGRRCVVVLGSVTECMQAGRLLAQSYLSTEVIKADPSRGQRGCVYGLEYDCAQDRAIKEAFSRAGIRPRRFYTGGSK